jgi:hypothetical protein
LTDFFVLGSVAGLAARDEVDVVAAGHTDRATRP